MYITLPEIILFTVSLLSVEAWVLYAFGWRPGRGNARILEVPLPDEEPEQITLRDLARALDSTPTRSDRKKSWPESL